MKALSIKQPWAWLIVHGYKNVENRDWPTHHKGPFLIHAGKKFDMEGYEWVKAHFPEIPLPLPSEFPLGGIVGHSTLRKCVPPGSIMLTEDHDRWYQGQYGFILECSAPITFFPLKGKLRFFNAIHPEVFFLLSGASCKSRASRGIFCSGRQRWRGRAAISGMMKLSHKHHNAREMDAIRPHLILQRWNVVQHELLPELKNEVGALTPKLERVIHTLEWVRIEQFVSASWCGTGRPPHERSWLANAFVAKAVLGLTSTVGLIERLTVDRALRRICGFPLCRKLPSEATFSRAFDEFAQQRLAERVHESLIKQHLGAALIGHLSRDGTAIEARERPARSTAAAPAAPSSGLAEDATAPTPAPPAKKRGRPRRGEVRAPAKVSPLQRQRQQSLAQMLEDIPTACDRGTKCNAQGYKISWNGYKLHLDTADCGVPIAALLSSASMHDSRAAIPLSLISAQRVTNLYDVMDAAYCSFELHEHCRSLGHVPLIDHNPRKGEKEAFEPADAVRYNERTVAERSNARLKDEFGARCVRVQGGTKVMGHLMFGVLALSADQLMRLRQ